MAITIEQLTKANVPAEYHQAVIDLNAADVRTTIDGSYVTKAAFEAERTKVKDATTQIEERDKQIANLGKGKFDEDSLKNKISDLEAANAAAMETYKKEMANKDKQIALISRLTQDNCVDPAEVATKFDLDAVKLDDNGIITAGYETQRDQIKAEKAYYFTAATNDPAPATAQTGTTPPGMVPVGTTPPEGNEGAKEKTGVEIAMDMAKSMAQAQLDPMAQRAQQTYFGGTPAAKE